MAPDTAYGRWPTLPTSLLYAPESGQCPDIHPGALRRIFFIVLDVGSYVTTPQGLVPVPDPGPRGNNCQLRDSQSLDHGRRISENPHDDPPG